MSLSEKLRKQQISGNSNQKSHPAGRLFVGFSV
jgi:hypothetical protein